MTLTDKAMLVDLNVSCWGAYKKDKKVSEEVAIAHNSDASMGHFSKQLVPRESFKKIYKVWGEVYRDHHTYSLPWLDSGWRVLSSDGYFKFMEKMRKHQTEWEKAVDEFVEAYPDRVEEAKSRLNGLWDQADYPDQRDLKKRFGLSVRVAPLPDAGDFRVALGDEEVAKVKQEIQKTQQEAVALAMKEVARRIEAVVGNMVKRLNAYNDGSGTFRDSLVGNVSELVSLIPALNISEDPEITALADRMSKELCSTTPDALRSNDTVREQTIKAANDILAKVSVFAA